METGVGGLNIVYLLSTSRLPLTSGEKRKRRGKDVEKEEGEREQVPSEF